ncbi:MAG: glycoside hydrolase family 20 zincin-like fold domain-containing protein, partial [Anaerolineales bacterium]
MNLQLILLPFPRQISLLNGSCPLLPEKYIQICDRNPNRLLFCAQQISDCIASQHHLSWQLTASRSIPVECIGLKLLIDPSQLKQPQGYKLTIKESIIDLIGNDPPGIFYGLQTLKQIINQSNNNHLPCLTVLDWPDFPVRGVMLDISRDKVYRLETLFMLIDELASWKINQLQLYTEHTFAYLGHDLVWQESSPMTAQDILTLDRYCVERFIELVPNQNTFGHMTRWLKHPQYQHLAERIQPTNTPWGHVIAKPFSLAPTLPETLSFISGLFDQLLPNFSSNMVNVGCDETF